MQIFKGHFSSLLGLLILVTSLLPALHAFDHEVVSAQEDLALDFKLLKTNADCELCDFHISNLATPPLFYYEVLPPQKETAYAISLAENVNLFPNPLFSLRAPPVV